MEVFFDFGLFELLAAVGFAALARVVYSRRWLGIAFLAVSVVAPATLLLLVRGGATRWLAAGCLGMALVNAAVVLGALQRGDVPIFSVPRRRKE